jgi:cold shock CspA family protein
MSKMHCKRNHEHTEIEPSMIYFDENLLGKRYICAVCGDMRVLNTGHIVKLSPKKTYGFITGPRSNIFFHKKNLSYRFELYNGLDVSYEIDFLTGDVNKKMQAKNIRPVNE